MRSIDLYKKAKLDVVSLYAEYLYDKKSIKDAITEYWDVIYKYRIYNEWFNCNVINEVLECEIYSHIDKIEEIKKIDFDDVISIHFINEFLRKHYFEIQDIFEYFEIDEEFMIKPIKSFNLEIEDDLLDYYAKSLKMHFDIKTNNYLNIILKMNEILALIEYFYKEFFISDMEYYELINLYHEIMINDYKKIHFMDLVNLFDYFDLIMDNLTKIFSIEKNKKSAIILCKK